MTAEFNMGILISQRDDEYVAIVANSLSRDDEHKHS